MSTRQRDPQGGLDLFSTRREALTSARAPLADRMRPRRLEEYIGQRHLLAPGKLLRRAIEADRVRSLILYGPPGTGKTTLAQVIAAHSNATFRDLNAILSGVKVIREEVQGAQERMKRFGQQTLLFIDELHRFNQAQQDALLPWVERGVVTLIGATTENPYFEVNAALNSRSHIFQLSPLSEAELYEVVEQALHDELRGYGALNVEVSDEALAHWARLVNGDARALLNALEVAVETTPPGADNKILIDLEVAEESIQARAVVYDRAGDAHFDHMSALIKSMRGSDADASLYWLAKMIYAGEPPRSIFRRLLIFASEDVGLAAPELLSVVTACAEAFDRVGMPEGRFHLSHATLALATAPKSNSTMGFFDALQAVERSPNGEVPNHLKDSNRDGEALGHGKGYLYPHAYAQHWVAQEHLPSALRGRVFYTPSQEGAEREIGARHQALREAQLEGTLNPELHPLIRSVSPHERQLEEWTARAMGRDAQLWQALRARSLELIELERDSVLLDLNPTSGLFTWAGLRASPEGGVYCWCLKEEPATLIQAQSTPLPWSHQPQVASGDLAELTRQVSARDLAFDRVISQRLLSDGYRLDDVLSALSVCLREGGRALLLESALEPSSLLSALIAESPELASRELSAWRQAEGLLLDATRSPLIQPDGHAERAKALRRYGLKLVAEESHIQRQARRLSPALLRELLSDEAGAYLSQLRTHGLGDEEANQVAQLMHERVGLTFSPEGVWWLFVLELRKT